MKNPHSQRTLARWQHDEVRRDGVKTNYTERLHEITILCCSCMAHDTGVPLAYAERAASRLPNARLRSLNAGHWTQRDYPDRSTGCCWSFLQRVESRRDTPVGRSSHLPSSACVATSPC